MKSTIPKELFEGQNKQLLEATAALGVRLETSIKTLSAVSRLTSVPIVAQDINHGASLILDTILSHLTDVTSCSLMLFDEQTGFLYLLEGKGQADFLGEIGGPYNKELKFKPGEGIAGQVFEDGLARYYDSTELEKYFIKSDKKPTIPNSLACLPLTSDERRLGIINISFGQDNPFDHTRKRDLLLLTEVIANTIQAYLLRKEVADSAMTLREKVLRLESEKRSRKLVEEEKANLEKQLREAQKMEAVGTLSGGIAHDFNNFLQGIAGYTQLLLKKNLCVGKGGRYLREIDKTVDRASSLIQRLLAFSRKLEPKLRPADLNKTIADANEIIEAAIPRMIRIRTTIPPDLPLIWGDTNQIEQILLNLITNARDAMPNGGTITISAEQEILEEKFCDLHLGSNPGEYVCLKISDSGQGIPQETLSRIFEPFFTSKPVGQGTGLGLAVVYGIVKTHKGYITCESELGQGTTFRIWFPICNENPRKRNQDLVLTADSTRGHETILLVDDLESILEISRTTLSESGYKVYTAPDGETALEILQNSEEKIELVILDLLMPGMGGEKCLVEMLKIDPASKIIITSGLSSEGKADKLTGMGALSFLKKPYRLKELLTAVRWALDQDRPQS